MKRTRKSHIMNAMTEAGAKKKWCHLTLSGDNLDECSASACMAWRWAQKPNPGWHPMGAGVFGAVQTNEVPMFIEDNKNGYCGLAGRP